MKLDVLSASAGTGKTYRLTQELVKSLLDDTSRPEGVVAITFTVKAASELASRIRRALLQRNRADLAERVRDGYIGTIHSVCQQLLRDFALEAGLSPLLEPIPESERGQLFDRALSSVVRGRESTLNDLARRLSIKDWKAELRCVVDRARENGMDAAALARSRTSSERGLSAILPGTSSTASEYGAKLLHSLERLVPALEAAASESATARTRAAMASAAFASARRHGLAPWKDQVQLANEVAVKKLAPVAGPLIELVDAHLGCAAFREDLFAFQRALFDLASQALSAFATEKAASRVVDFGDMLALACELLAQPAVRAALSDRLDLVLVDEFQDTSPIQLAVVASLGAVAKRSIWVGDRKQAIFAFQGSDPDLMTAATDFALEGREPDLLSTSWRSRPALVELVSEVFAPALLPHGFPEKQVRLTARPDPQPLAKQPCFEVWRWSAGRIERDGKKVPAKEPEAIAAGIAALLASPPTVRERVEAGEEQLRPASCRDVAVLAFTNPKCLEIAAALRARGIPAKVSLDGLPTTPEALLVRAALGLIADPADGVAALEVRWLGSAGAADPDAWLSRRFAEVAQWRAAREAAEKTGARPPPLPHAFEDDPRVAALREAAASASGASPSEALDLALRAARIPELLRCWPEPGQRLANLEALRAAARAYEALCTARRSACTVLGLVSQLSELDEESEQAAPSAEDSVTVSTWHRAKGLEWPVVVLATLGHDKQRSAFDATVEPAPKLDFAAPLAGRWVRYWPWPYGHMSKGLDLDGRAAQSPEARSTAKRDGRERLRLLYVGFTRARDLLIPVVGMSAKGVADLSALEPLRAAEGTLRVQFPLDAPPGSAKVMAGKKSWHCVVRELSGFPEGAVPAVRSAVSWYAAGERASGPREVLNPSSEPLAIEARVEAVFRLAGRGKLSAREEDLGRVGDAFHGFLAADPGAASPTRQALAARLLAMHRVTGALDPLTLLGASDALREWLDARYPGAKWFREWPVRARLSTNPPRLVIAEVDLFLELADGFVLVDHKSFPGREGERDRKLTEEWAPQLGWYAQVLTEALKKPLLAAFVHLPIRGELAQLSLKVDDSDGRPGPVTRRDALVL